MNVITAIIFAGEVILTFLKSMLLSAPKITSVGNGCAVMCFIFESLLGFVLSFLLAITAWNVDPNQVNIELARAGVIIISCTEILSVVTEGVLMRANLTHSSPKLSNRGNKRRQIMKWMSFLVGTGTVVNALFFEEKNYGKQLQLPNQNNEFLLSVLGISLACTVSLMVLTYVFRSRKTFRAISSITLLLLGIIVVFVYQFARQPQSKAVPFAFTSDVEAAVFCGAVSSAITSIAAWGVPAIESQGMLGEEHVTLFETAAFGMTGPTILLGTATVAGNSAKKVLLTILPQVGAVLTPVAMAFATTIFARGKTTNTAFDVPERTSIP